MRQLSPLNATPNKPRPRPPLAPCPAEQPSTGQPWGTAALVSLALTCAAQVQIQAPRPLLQEEFATRRALYAVPLECTRPDQIDGFWVGGDGYAYSPEHFQAGEIPGFQPSQPARGRSYYVNGILTWPHGSLQADSEAQRLAEASSREIVLIYNATSGNALEDGWQTLQDRALRSRNPATATLRATVASERATGRPLSLIGYSQGAAVISAALARDTGQDLEVLTLAGAGLHFPSGARVTVLVNQRDPISNLLGPHEGWLFADGRVRRFSDPGRSGAGLMDTDGAHGLDTYLKAVEMFTSR